MSAAVRWLRGRPTWRRTASVCWAGAGAAGRRCAGICACLCKRASFALLLCQTSRICSSACATPMLVVCGGADPICARQLPAFRKLLEARQAPGTFHVAEKVGAGFMGPPDKNTYAHDAAEDAWIVIYNFLEKHVEDARVPEAPSVRRVATIADIMRAVNESTGLRGARQSAGARAREP